jgi:antitoxin (DNA-binding transcriptional repressor) of toxin-antitoxin stability system
MEKATISQLRDRLSAYLRKVRSGETVIVFDRDRPIARIEGVTGRMDIDERMARLEAQGLVRRPTAPLLLGALREQQPRAEASVLEALLEERREGR